MHDRLIVCCGTVEAQTFDADCRSLDCGLAPARVRLVVPAARIGGAGGVVSPSANPECGLGTAGSFQHPLSSIAHSVHCCIQYSSYQLLVTDTVWFCAEHCGAWLVASLHACPGEKALWYEPLLTQRMWLTVVCRSYVSNTAGRPLLVLDFWRGEQTAPIIARV